MEALIRQITQEIQGTRDEIRALRKDLLREMGAIRNVLGVSPQGMGRGALLDLLEERGETIRKVWESTGRKPDRPDVVVETDRAVYILEAKHQIDGAREAMDVLKQLERGERLVREGKIGNLKIPRGRRVVWAVYAFVISPTALEVLKGKIRDARPKKAVIVLYEGGNTIAQ